MREFKKYFFEGLLQLTILATLLRHNSYNNNYLHRPHNSLEELVLNSTSLNPRNFTLELTYLSGNEQAANYLDKIDALNDSSHVSEELRRLNRLLELTTPAPPLLHPPHLLPPPQPPQLFVAPSFFFMNNNNQKDVINLSETRLLLNSIEFNNNQLTKEDIEMDIDIQTIIQQDIDLGIKKSLNYEYELASSTGECNNPSACSSSPSSAASSGEFDLYNKYFGDRSSPAAKAGATHNHSSDFVFKPPLLESENLKNEDILSVENFFASEPIPNGFKLIVEEDTGECLIIVIRNDTMNHSNSETEKADENNAPIDLGFELDFVEQNVELFLANTTEKKENRTTSRETGEETTTTTTVSNEEKEKQEEMKQQQQVVAFLSQTSVNSELVKLGTTSGARATSENDTVTLDEAMTSIEPTLLDEEWISHFLAGSAEPQPQSHQVNNEQQIGNDAMLSTLNSNNSVISNDAANTATSMLFDRDSAAALLATNGSLFGPSNASIDFASLLNNTESLEFLFSPLMTETNTTKEVNTTTANVEQFDQLIFNNTYATEEVKTIETAALDNLIEEEIAKHNRIHPPQQQQSSLINTTFIKEEAVDLDGSSSQLLNQQQHIVYTNMTPTTSSASSNEYVEWSREAALSGFRHNHTYLGGEPSMNGDMTTMNSQAASSSIELHPYSYKSKMLKRLQKQQVLKSEAANMTGRLNQSRDEQSLRDAGIGLSLEEVVDSSADEFNEIIRVNAFGVDQIALLKDIRRRGKNKVAAQICRKRKLDSIDSLKEEVDDLKTLKSKLISEYNAIHDEIKDMTSKFDSLYKDAVGASNYETNDPIVVFINNLKKLNSEPINPINPAPTAATSSVRDRKKTFSSINSSDVDSSNHSLISDLEDDEDEYDDEEDDDVDDEVDEESSEEIEVKPVVSAKPKQKSAAAANNQNKKLKRN